MSDGAIEDSPVPLPLVVNEVPLTPSLRWAHLRKLLARMGDDMLSIAIFSTAIVGIIVPPVTLFFSGLWSTWAYVTGVWALWQEIKTWRIADIFTSLVAVDASGRFALTSVSYFALIFSFIVLFAGLLGRHWQHIFVVPGILLCATSVVVFTLAATLSFSVLATRWHLPGWLQYPLVGYVMLDALLLAVLLLDLRPSTRHKRLARRQRRHEAPIEETALKRLTPLPLVRFGPSQPLSEVDKTGILAQPAKVMTMPPTTSDIEDMESQAVFSVPGDVAATMPREIQAPPVTTLTVETPTGSEVVVPSGNCAP